MESPHKTATTGPREGFSSLFTEKGKFRISPVKNRESLMLHKPIKPFSSSIIQEKKPSHAKEDFKKISSKI